MEFDKSRVYTALNADELKVGSKVILSDNLSYLKECVEHSDCIVSLKAIKSELFGERFFDGGSSWCLAYLVEEPEEKKLEWTDLKVGDVIKNNKEHKTVMVVQIDEDCTDLHILAGNKWLGEDDFEDWVKEDKNETDVF